MKKIIIIFTLIFPFSCMTVDEYQQSKINSNPGYKRIESSLIEKKEPIIILRNFKVDNINYLGGVDIIVSFKNISSKTIKYITFIVVPYNEVGDIVKCEIRKKAEMQLQITGPIESNAIEEDNKFENVWYNNTVSKIKIKRINIVYMDKTSASVSSKKIDDITIDVDKIIE